MGAPIKDKELIHRDYISTDISVKQLADKYGVAQSTLFNWMKDGGWTAEKRAIREEAEKRALERFEVEVEEYVDILSMRANKIYHSADLLLQKLDALLELEDALAPRDLKSLSSTLMDIKMIHDIRSEEDREAKELKVTIVGGGEIDA